MRKYDDDDALVKCPVCPAYMVPLNDYEISNNDEGPTADTEFWEFLVWGWMSFVYNYIFGWIEFNGRKAKLAELKKNDLPQFPASLVCPQCLHVVKRR